MLGLDDFVTEVMAIPGALDALIVDHNSGMPVASGGLGPGLEHSAAALSETLRAAMEGLATSAGGTVRIADMIVVSDRGYHLFRPLETRFDGPLVVYVHLDLERSNLALARHRLESIAARLDA
ncbi:hypothetical protein [Thermoactinospora rubra]|uniref:hypothetical protein n=1 Tax=Thermoactinospora rubra TaxID=1088767 RepID=UPI000A0FAAEF|nr:hypothetical protein [Thermoactinospora rubra]